MYVANWVVDKIAKKYRKLIEAPAKKGDSSKNTTHRRYTSTTLSSYANQSLTMQIVDDKTSSLISFLIDFGNNYVLLTCVTSIVSCVFAWVSCACVRVILLSVVEKKARRTIEAN